MALFSKESAPAAPRAEARPAAPSQTSGGTLIGSNVTIEGTITGSEAIVVEGTVRGQIDLGSDLRIGLKARVEAKVHARNVTIEGRLTGDVTADDRIELVASAAVDGNVKAPKIIVAEGAKFRGSVDMGSKVPHDEAAKSK